MFPGFIGALIGSALGVCIILSIVSYMDQKRSEMLIARTNMCCGYEGFTNDNRSELAGRIKTRLIPAMRKKDVDLKESMQIVGEGMDAPAYIGTKQYMHSGGSLEEYI